MILESIIKMGFNYLLFVTVHYRGLNHLELYGILIIKTGLKLYINFVSRYLKL